MRTAEFSSLDLVHLWHPFTDHDLWEKSPPLVISRGEGSWLHDTEGKSYLDANSSIWTNIHGHSHPKIVDAICDQSRKLCHSSFLGFSNERACELAARLCGFFPEGTLDRCFFSDNGSTALEVALKMSRQWNLQNGAPGKTGIIAFENAYHGDTLGAASVGGVSRFVKGSSEDGFPTYRIENLEQLNEMPEVVRKSASALVIEPLVQGVNQMNLWPPGMLAKLRGWTHKYGIHLILDEVMTGFGRTGAMFACQKESVIPDFLCLAKGLTGGTMPLAATLTTEKIFDGFRGPGRTFYYGHSYTGNSLGCAAALANLDVFEQEKTLTGVEEKGRYLEEEFSKIPGVQNVRRVGLVIGFDVGDDGAEFCQCLRDERIITRPILNTIVIMPPLSISTEELRHLVKGVRVAAGP